MTGICFVASLVAMTVIPIEIVITGLDPVIHLLGENVFAKMMDARIKSGHDGCVRGARSGARFALKLRIRISNSQRQFVSLPNRHCERSEAIHLVA